MQSMSSQASSWTLMEDFFVQECCVHGTDLENHSPTSILCDDPLPIESNKDVFFWFWDTYSAFPTIIIKSLSVFCVVFMQLWLKIKRCHLNEDEYCAAVRCHNLCLWSVRRGNQVFMNATFFTSPCCLQRWDPTLELQTYLREIWSI